MSDLTFKKEDIEYVLRVSKKARNMRITVGLDGSVTVTVPGNANPKMVERLISEKIEWVRSTLEKLKPFKKKINIKAERKNSRLEFKKNKDKALALAKERVEFYNKIYRFTYKKISIRNQKTRWGSCSRNGNLSFNHKIVSLSPELSDYIIVHEICHLKEFNHSKKFWALVEKTIPDYKIRRKKLKM